MPASRQYKIRRLTLHRTIRPTLRGAKGPSKGSSVMICRQTSSQTSQELQPCPRHRGERSFQKGYASTLPRQHSSFCKTLFCEAWLKSDPTPAKHILTSHKPNGTASKPMGVPHHPRPALAPHKPLGSVSREHHAQLPDFVCTFAVSLNTR